MDTKSVAVAFVFDKESRLQAHDYFFTSLSLWAIRIKVQCQFFVQLLAMNVVGLCSVPLGEVFPSDFNGLIRPV